MRKAMANTVSARPPKMSDKAYAVPCVVCGAAEGEPCIQQGGDYRGDVRTNPHPDRKVES